jgi:hypothetical protein
MSPEITNAYTPPRRVAEGLHCVEGWWKKSPMGRRMTLMQVGNDELAVHSAVRMSEPDMQRLDAIGRVAYVIAPNPFHASEAPWYADRYPQAKILLPEAMRRKQERRMRIDGTIEAGWPAELAGELEALLIDGLRLPETAYWHLRSRTLVVTDLVMNFGNDHFRGVLKFLMRINGIVGRFGPSRLFRAAIKDKSALRASLARVMQWDFDRVMMSHGRVLETDGKARMTKAFAFLD